MVYIDEEITVRNFIRREVTVKFVVGDGQDPDTALEDLALYEDFEGFGQEGYSITPLTDKDLPFTHQAVVIFELELA
jgi:hypothetical protein